MRKSFARSISILLALTSAAFGLESFECALLINANSQDSLELGNFYAELRGIPDENVIHLDLPDAAIKSPFRISVEQFHTSIREPVLSELRRRRVADGILAWIYSCDFPASVDIGAGAIMSLQGLTLCGDDIPDAELVSKAEYVSPIYAGPGPEIQELRPSRSFDRLLAPGQIGEIVPSMMLSFTRGTKALDIEESKQHLQRGLLADGSAPSGTIYFVSTEDESRSKPREWQFAPAVDILKRAGVAAISTNSLPVKAAGIMGLQVGTKALKISALGHFRAGAVADNLTSWGATFENPWHTKITEWLRAGATASAGTVTEPYALWPKFPTAFFFHHYRSGCSIIESYFQSIRSPVQVMLVGEPLARPWIRKIGLTLIALEDGVISGDADFYARIMLPNANRIQAPITFKLDGKLYAEGVKNGHLRIPTAKLSDGHHILRGVIETASPVNVRPSGKLEFMLDNRGRVPELSAPAVKSSTMLGDHFNAVVTAGNDPVAVGVRSRQLVLAEQDGDRAEFELDTELLGAGRVPIQAFARYADGETTLGERLIIQIERRPREDSPPATAPEDS
jgi:uncharacterized protein (TIGR03790 family)